LEYDLMPADIPIAKECKKLMNSRWPMFISALNAASDSAADRSLGQLKDIP
jgi:hypothetical protein